MSSPALPRTSRLSLPRTLIVVGAPIMAALLLLVVAGSYFTQKERLRLEAQRAATADQAASHGRHLESLVESATAVPGLLSGLLPAARSGPEFDRVVARLGKLNRGLREVRIERVDGEMRRYSRGRLLAPAPGDPSLASGQVPAGLEPDGAVTATLSGDQLWFSQALYRLSNNGAPLLWGHVRVALGTDAIIEHGLLDELPREGYHFQLSYAADGTAPLVLRAAPAPLLAPAVKRIALPNGDTLLLEVAPRTPWSVNPFLYVEITLALVAAALLGVVLHLLLRHPDAFLRYAHASPAGRAHAIAGRKDGNSLRPTPRAPDDPA